MTRSIGDRGAARACVPTPDITTTFVHPKDRGRIIIASDGVWDVVGDTESEAITRGSVWDSPVKDSCDAAVVLAKKAHESRAFESLTPDDSACVWLVSVSSHVLSRCHRSSAVTVIVLDIAGGGLRRSGDEGNGCCSVQ